MVEPSFNPNGSADAGGDRHPARTSAIAAARSKSVGRYLARAALRRVVALFSITEPSLERKGKRRR
jgi:hypothetical protein